MKKDKIYELRIDEEDEISGIDSISLVDEPAIEVNWVAFNKHKHSTTQEHFDIPDGEDMKFSSRIIEKGHLEEELFNDGWEVVKQDFVSSSPNAPSFEDTEERLIRYKYVLNPEAPGAPIKETTREFCRELLNKNLVYRVEDLESITNDLGSSALVWRGSYNCRHQWKKIEYRRGTDIVNKGSITKGRIDGAESYDVLGYPQPDTRVPEWPSFSKQGFKPGVPHYTKDGKLYEGPTHKDASGRLMTGAVHTEDSEYLYHEDELGYDVGGLPSYVDQVSGKTTEKSISFETNIECEKMSKQNFQTDDEKKMVVGPAMIPDLKIFRKDSKGNPYYVYFSADTIKMIAEKYMRNKYIDNNDENHNGKAVSDVYVVESWIVEDPQYDKSKNYGFSVPAGTWMVSMRVRNDEVWKKVKNGELRGFSVSGFFLEIADFAREQMFLQEVVKILKKY